MYFFWTVLCFEIISNKKRNCKNDPLYPLSGSCMTDRIQTSLATWHWNMTWLNVSSCNWTWMIVSFPNVLSSLNRHISFSATWISLNSKDLNIMEEPGRQYPNAWSNGLKWTQVRSDKLKGDLRSLILEVSDQKKKKAYDTSFIECGGSLLGRKMEGTNVFGQEID